MGGSLSAETGAASDDQPRQVAVVFGAVGGLGAGVARVYAERGWDLMLCDIEDGPLDNAVATLSGVSGAGDVSALAVDITKPEQVDAVREGVAERFGRVDLVFNTVAVTKQNPVYDTPILDWRWIMEVNFYGALNIANTFVPFLSECGGGRLVHTSSTTAVAPGRPTSGPYLVSKHAVIALCEALQQDLRAAGSATQVSVALPGTVRSNIATSERNRQPEFGQGQSRPDAVKELQEHLERNGVDGYDLALEVIRQLDKGKFYAFGRESDMAVATARYDSIMSGVLPEHV